MSTKAQVIAAICANLQLPGVNDTLEAEGVGRAVGLVYDHLPPFIWTFVVTAADGLDTHEVDDIMDSVSRSLARRANMPWVPESLRAELIKRVLAIVRETAQIDRYLVLTPVS